EGTGPGGALFASIGGGPPVMRWDGEAWEDASGDVFDPHTGPVETLATAPDGTLYAGASLIISPGPGGERHPLAFLFARSPAGVWGTVGEGRGLDDQATALALGPDGAPFVGGYFRFAGPARVDHVARWDADAGAWTPLGQGLDGPVGALALGPDGRLYVGGGFATAYQADGSALPASRVVAYDLAERRWEPLGAGVRH